MVGNFYIEGKQEKVNIQELLNEVAAIEEKLDNPTWGLAALKGELDNCIIKLDDCIETLGKLIPIAKGSVFNTAVVANTDIFAADLTPTNTPCTFRIYACFVGAGVLTVRRTSDGVTVSEQLNSGANLTANASFIFDILVNENESVNLQYSVGTTALKLSVIEIGGAT
jgi:hypothetical protein